MKIGFIIGKEGEEYTYDDIRDKVPKKYYKIDEYGESIINTDVAIAFTVKERYPTVKVDIIQPKDVSIERLKKNDINYILGYDYVSALNNSPYVKKFSGPVGSKKVASIYKSPSSKVFPDTSFLSFIWDKKKYLQTLEKNNIPIIPTVFVNVNQLNIKSLVTQIKQKKWKKFIIKPNGGTEKLGVGIFTISDSSILDDLSEYFQTNKTYYKEFLVQQSIDGFFKYGEIKSYWINGQFSYAVSIRDQNTGGDAIYDDLITVTEIINPKILSHCESLGKRVMEVIPDVKYKKKSTIPVMVRIDFGCCLGNKAKTSANFFVNEIEHQDAGSLTNYEDVHYPYVEVMADSFVKKARELIKH
jgi:hypothetical protein